jgi:hypothetical protein
MSYRLPIVMMLFGGFALLGTAERGWPAVGDKTTEANLKNQVSQLQQQVTQLQTANTQAQTTQKTLQSTIDGYRGAGLIHIVMLKAKADAKVDSADSKSRSDSKPDAKTEPQKLIDDAYSQLTKIKGVRGLWAGKPAAKGSPDASGDYTVALVVVLDDAAGLKTYLNDSAHTKFAEKHLKNYETPVVFDLEPRKPQP